MGLTPAQRHFERETARMQAAASASSDTMAGATGYELMLAKLHQDRTDLKAIQSMEAKVAHKLQILPDYADYVAGAVEGGTGAQDDVLMTVMIWSIDVGIYEAALPIAEYALAHDMSLPDQYQRKLACLIAEEAADRELAEIKAERVANTRALIDVERLTAGKDMPDEVRAKLHKALGLGLAETEPKQALAHLQRAVELHDKVGVKPAIKALEARIANNNGADGSDASTA